MSQSGQFKGWVVLIVDDEPDNVDVAAKILSFYGADVYTAENGAEGLALLKEITPTVILLDLSMPTMDGWEMLRAVREDARWAAFPVIALTAHAMAGDRDKALEAGFDDYISKPFRLGDFLVNVQQCIERLGDKISVQK